MKLNWMNYSFDKFDGYGYWGIQYIRELLQLGITVYPTTFHNICWWLKSPGWIQQLNSPVDFRNLTIACTSVNSIAVVPGRQWASTMYESSNKIPDEWAHILNNRCERVIVPCQQNAEVFHANGVRIPIHVIPGGISPAEFPIVPPVPEYHRDFTFIGLGDRGARKGIETYVSAFCRGFKRSEPVRLIIKGRSTSLRHLQSATFVDANISIWRDDVDSMADVYAQADCFIFPSYGEGWGLPPREAVAMGIPTIVPRHSGLMDGIDKWATRIIETMDEGAAYLPVRDAKWYLPDIEETAAHMRWVYENRQEAKLQALRGAGWLRENQTWAHAAQKFMDLIQEF